MLSEQLRVLSEQLRVLAREVASDSEALRHKSGEVGGRLGLREV